MLGALLPLACDTHPAPEPTPPPTPPAATAAPPSTPASAPASQPAPAHATPPGTESGAAEEARLTVLVANQQDGELEPCGCAEGQYGGLPRRANLVQAWRMRGRVVVIADNGDLVTDGGLQSQQKFETTLQVHQLTGTLAINLGERDLLLDPQMVELGALNFGVPIVSANVRPAGRTHVVVPVETPGGVVRVGLTGFLDPHLVERAQPGWQVQAPAPALRPVLAELAGTADLTVLLAHATAARTSEVLDGLEPPDLVVVAHETEDPLRPVPTVLRGVPALAPGTQGKYMARMEVTVDHGEVRVVPEYEGLDERIPDLPAARAMLDNYQAILKQLNVADMTPRTVPPYAAGGSYVGPQLCAECHEPETAIWTESAHAHAMDTLLKANHEFDPDCLGCHTTGFAFEGGYLSRAQTPQLAAVSCETCHGPGSNHAEDPGKGYGKVTTPTFCFSCHDDTTSPHFDYQAYWAKIAHGTPAQAD